MHRRLVVSALISLTQNGHNGAIAPHGLPHKVNVRVKGMHVRIVRTVIVHGLNLRTVQRGLSVCLTTTSCPNGKFVNGHNGHLISAVRRISTLKDGILVTHRRSVTTILRQASTKGARRHLTSRGSQTAFNAHRGVTRINTVKRSRIALTPGTPVIARNSGNEGLAPRTHRLRHGKSILSLETILVTLSSRVVNHGHVRIVRVKIRHCLKHDGLQALGGLTGSVSVAIMGINVNGRVRRLTDSRVSQLHSRRRRGNMLTRVPIIHDRGVLTTLIRGRIRHQFVVLQALHRIVHRTMNAQVRIRLKRITGRVNIHRGTTTMQHILGIMRRTVRLIGITLNVVTLLPGLVPMNLTSKTDLINPLIPGVTIRIVRIVKLLLVSP